MHDKVILQNNYNISSGAGTSYYQNGTVVFLRTAEDDMEHPAEFIMKGGIIRGNVNNTQNPLPCGGGVYISASPLLLTNGARLRPCLHGHGRASEETKGEP